LIARRFSSALLLSATVAFAALHHHEDLASSGPGSVAPAERVLSGHSPLSRDAHWHSGTRVKDDPCLACQGHRLPGLAAEFHGEARQATERYFAERLAVARLCECSLGNGSRAPPALL